MMKSMTNRGKRAGEEAWVDLRTGVDTAWKNLDESIAAAKSRFK